MELTLGVAAKMMGLNKTTLSRHIKAGKLSAQRLDGGGYAIDASELARAYDLQIDATGTRLERRSDARPGGDPPVTHSATPAATGDVLVVELRAQLAQAQATVEDLRTRLDASEARLDRVLHSLPAPVVVTPPPGPASAAPASRPGLLARLLGRS